MLILPVSSKYYNTYKCFLECNSLKLKIVLLSVNGVLNGVEEKQIRNLAVKDRLEGLQRISWMRLHFAIQIEVSDFNPAYLNFHDLDIETKMEENLERLDFLVKMFRVEIMVRRP